ncbi:MAG: cytochrome b [Cellvibrionaceae bacterium]|nr:cytochrome b [Cellvibrionaceae bacterium]
MYINSDSQFGRVSKVIHWLVAVTIFSLFGVGLWMGELTYYDDWYQTAPHYHKSVGILLGLLMVIRVMWMFRAGKPKPLVSHQAWEVTLSKLTHLLLYLLVFAIVVSGYLISTADGRGLEVFNWFQIPALGSLIENQEDIAGEIHEILAFTLIGLAVLHAAAAIKHHVIDKDSTLRRML